MVLLIASACATTNPQGEKVRIAKSEDEVFGCEDKGPVTARGVYIEDARNSARNKAAALGGNVLRVDRESPSWATLEGRAFNCDPAAIRARDEALVAAANRTVVCVAGPDCEYKWSRAMQWVQEHSNWKFRTVTDTS